MYLSFVKIFAGYILGRLWAALAHRCLHMRPFYKYVHKRHHVRTHELVATGAWLDHPLEYLIMEIPSLLCPLLLFPTKLAFHQAFFIWHGFSAATDHSGFTFTKENGASWFYRNFFDSEYHYYHHKVSSVNYAEMEWIDYLFGTHHTQKLRAKAQQNRLANSVAADAATTRKPSSASIHTFDSYEHALSGTSDSHVRGPDGVTRAWPRWSRRNRQGSLLHLSEHLQPTPPSVVQPHCLPRMCSRGIQAWS